jgi:hypothetical protein
MPNLLKDHETHCLSCGVPNTPEVNRQLWDIYGRIIDGRSRAEPLVYTMEEYQDSWDDDGETNWATLAMEKDMYNRGLCPTCGRPDLSGVNPEDIMSEEDAKDMHEMWSEQEAERRMGA